jgi:hypothetical protein
MNQVLMWQRVAVWSDIVKGHTVAVEFGHRGVQTVLAEYRPSNKITELHKGAKRTNHLKRDVAGDSWGIKPVVLVKLKNSGNILPSLPSSRASSRRRPLLKPSPFGKPSQFWK